MVTNYEIYTIENEKELNIVLNMCYKILGEHLRDTENYRYEDWKNRLESQSNLLLFATVEGVVVSAVLGREENKESLIVGFVACETKYRKQGITKAVMDRFISNAKIMNYKYITLGAASDANVFYEKCGYHCINKMHGQNIYQKLL